LPAPSELSGPVVLTRREELGAGLHLVTLEPPPDLARAYVAPGQYIHVRVESAGYFVLAGPLGAGAWELLVRASAPRSSPTSGAAAEALVTSPLGTSFDVAGPLGQGFPMASARGRSLVVAVVGSALAVARPIVRERLTDGSGPNTHLYVGARAASDVPLPGEVGEWARAGARVVLCLSSLDGDVPNALTSVAKQVGRVQQVIAKDLAERRLGHALVFAAGPEGMLGDLRAVGESRGVLAVEGAAPILEVVTNV
jgi:NAD(P)H-flavin reductase